MTRSVRRLLGAAVLVAIFGATVVVLAPGPATAATTCPHPSLTQQVKQADVVFRGVVDKVRPVRGQGSDRFRTYRVKADRVYQGSLVTDAVVVTAEVGARCPPPTLAHGKRYVFFATEQGSRLVSTASTARATHRLTAQVVAKLGTGEQPHPPPPVKASFTKVADATPPRLSRLLAPGAALVVVSLLGLVLVTRSSRRPTR